MDRDTLKAHVAELYKQGVDDEAVQAYISANPLGGDAAPAAAAAPVGAGGAGAGDDYQPTLIPLKRVPEGTGIMGSSIGFTVPKIASAIAGIPKDILDTAEQSRASWESGDIDKMKKVAPGAALLAIGAPPAIEAAAPVVKGAATAVADATRLAPKEVAPTLDQVYQGSKNAYAVVDNSGVRVSPEPFQHFADQLGGELKGYNPKLPSRAPETAKTLKELKNYANEEDAIKFSELADMKSTITNSISAVGTNPNDKRLLGQIGDHLDEFMRSLKSEHLDVGEGADVTTAQSALDTAKDLWHKDKKMGVISQIMETAALQKYPDRYIQQQFTAITRKPKKMDAYTADEQKIIKDVANGGKLDTLAKWFAPSGDRVGFLKGALGSTIGAAAGTAALGLPGAVGAVALPALGMGAKALSESARLKGVQALQDTIALGHRPLTVLDRWKAERATQRGGVSLPPPDELP